ncbi:MAG: CxxH/CxxC protein, partial [Bacillota bacterium]
MIAVCLEHLERAIDEYLVQYEQAPDILNLAQAQARGLIIPP